MEEKIDPNTPIWQLTVGQFERLIKGYQQKDTVVFDYTKEPECVYGLSGIAKLFDCSKSTAMRIKSTGQLKGAITQIGRKIIVDKKKVLELNIDVKKKQ